MIRWKTPWKRGCVLRTVDLCARVGHGAGEKLGTPHLLRVREGLVERGKVIRERTSEDQPDCCQPTSAGSRPGFKQLSAEPGQHFGVAWRPLSREGTSPPPVRVRRGVGGGGPVNRAPKPRPLNSQQGHPTGEQVVVSHGKNINRLSASERSGVPRWRGYLKSVEMRDWLRLKKRSVQAGNARRKREGRVPRIPDRGGFEHSGVGLTSALDAPRPRGSCCSA